MKNVYDKEVFFNEYQKMRNDEINANNLIEIPIMKSFLPDLENKIILDLGCGSGDMDMYFVSKGAKKIVATDISVNMIENARVVNNHQNIEYHVLKMEEIYKLEERFDIVYSSLAFHYIEDFDLLLKNIHNLLKPNGILVFSQESPVNMATSKQEKDAKNKLEINGKLYHLLNGYCKEGEISVWWNDTFVTKYHRTYATIVNSLIKNNFEIIELKDSYASEEAIKLCPKYANQIDKPYFTFVKAYKISI